MRAYFLEASGTETRLAPRDVPVPEEAPGQLLVCVRAAGLNRGEFIVGHGRAKPGTARPAGNEASAEVVRSGERVMGRCPGAFAEYALMDAREAIAIPAGLSWEQAAAIPLTFMVVHDMHVAQGQLKAREWLLVTGGSSGVGVAALQVAKGLGATGVGTSGSDKKLSQLARLGLDFPIQTRKGDFHDAVMKATDGKGANLAVNTVGGSVV